MIFYNNPDFYPTPSAVIDKMLTDDSPAGLVVLEPSAGSGNIVRKLNECGAAEVLVCEKDPNLQRVLRGEKCRLIASDFLTVTAEEVSHVRMIVMNPPFSQGARHIEHAYNIAPAGCVIVSLVNSSNLGSSYLRSYNKLQELVKLHGYSEDLGAVFAEDAERQTRCRVSLVKLWKEGEGEEEFNGYFSILDEDTNNGKEEGLIQYSFMREIVSRYISACKMFNEVMEATQKINRAAKYVDYNVTTTSEGEQRAVPNDYGPLPITFQAVAGREFREEVNYSTYKRELQKYYWRVIFRKLNMEKYATRELKEQINKYIEQRQHVPFTIGNIYRVIDTVIQTTGQRMTRALCEAFDTICDLSAENSTAGEKWKTNANYMVNRRFICDWITEIRWGGGMDIRMSYSSTNPSKAERIDDVCKALCYMTARKWEEIGELRTYVCKHQDEIEWGKWFEWGFFRCRGYKKGTMHFEFLDEKVWNRFNQEVARVRGWKIGKTTEKARRR